MGAKWVFKYREPQLGREHRLLKKLIGVPGVVQVDTEFSVDDLGTNDADRTRSLLVLKTIGRPLSSYKTILEFLEDVRSS